MIYELRFKNTKTSSFQLHASSSLSILFCLCSFFFLSTVSFAQVKSSIDSTKIKIGAQITYKIEVEADTTEFVGFPEGQTFSPLEMIESYKIDTTKTDAKYKLIKNYGLTQFDSGHYTIPRQKIIIGNKTFYTDSVKVEVNTIKVDTTKQGLYDIKPYIQVEKTSSEGWKTLLIILGILLIAAFFLYWFIWRKKPLTEEEEIALLPPYERAKMALKKLDETDYLQQSELKGYYSELTFIIRKYLDEKVYDRALESTTDELISRLNLLKDGNQIELSKEDIRNIETILKRADLVKFAKSAPDVELAKIDRNTIDMEIDHVKEALPEPTEEEKLLNQQYKEAQAQKKKRKKIIATVVIALFLIFATVTGFVIKYGFDYVKDTITGHPTKELLEGDWVTSKYGVPPIKISTPKVLRRLTKEEKGFLESDVEKFIYVSYIDKFAISLTVLNDKNEDAPQIINQDVLALSQIKAFEKELNAKNIITKEGEFETPNGVKGKNIKGTMDILNPVTNENNKVNYNLLSVSNESDIYVFYILYDSNDMYAPDIEKRIFDSIEINVKSE